MSLDQFLLSADTTDFNYPEIRPTLDLNFARTKTLDPRITFARSSGGSYVGPDGLIKYAGVNEARFDHNPVTGESLGLLIEESRTNLFTLSNNFSPNVPPITVTNNFATSPDGTLTATRLLGTSSGTGSYLNVPVSEGITYTLSVYAKRNTGTGNLLLIIYDLPSVNSTEQTFTLTDNWQRFTISRTVGASQTSVQCRFVGSVGSGDSFDILVWGAQLEVGAFPTSYIPTVASTRTRAADNASITGRNFNSFYRQDEGTLFASARVNALGGLGFPGIAYVDDGTLNNSMGFYVSDAGDDKIGAEGYVSSVPQYPFLSISAASPAQLFKVISTYKVNDFSAAFSMGGTVGTDTSGSVPTVNRLLIGSLRGDLSKLNGPVSRITYYPKRLPNAQLQALTR